MPKKILFFFTAEFLFVDIFYWQLIFVLIHFLLFFVTAFVVCIGALEILYVQYHNHGNKVL